MSDKPNAWTVRVMGDGQWYLLPEYAGRPPNPTGASRYGGIVWSKKQQRRRIEREIRREERRLGVSDLPVTWP
jgi:hypothetical protein